MRKLSIALTAATAVVAGMSLFGGNTQAAVVAAPKGILAGANTLNPVQTAQVYHWDGRRYCWTGIKSDTSGTGITALSIGSSAVSDG